TRIRTTKPKILCKLPRIFLRGSWERTHPACRAFETRSTLEAGSVRSRGRNFRSLRLCGEIRFGCGWAAPCSSVVSFILLVAAMPRQGWSFKCKLQTGAVKTRATKMSAAEGISNVVSEQPVSEVLDIELHADRDALLAQ